MPTLFLFVSSFTRVEILNSRPGGSREVLVSVFEFFYVGNFAVGIFFVGIFLVTASIKWHLTLTSALSQVMICKPLPAPLTISHNSKIKIGAKLKEGGGLHILSWDILSPSQTVDH